MNTQTTPRFGRTYLCRNTCGGEQTGVLVHIEGDPTYGVRLQNPRSEVVYEAKGRDDKGGGTGQLCATIWRWVIPGRS